MIENKYDYAIENKLLIAERDGTIYKKYYNGKFKKAPQHVSKTNGYKTVSINVRGKQYNLYSHRIVAKSFIPNPENKDIVNHIDRNRINNCVQNLEWCTPLENTQHARRTNPVYRAPKRLNRGQVKKKPKTRRSYKIKSKVDLSNIDLKELEQREKQIVVLRFIGKTYKQIGDKFNISRQRVQQIIKEIENKA